MSNVAINIFCSDCRASTTGVCPMHAQGVTFAPLMAPTTGWLCPGCGTHWSPYVSACSRCAPRWPAITGPIWIVPPETCTGNHLWSDRTTVISGAIPALLDLALIDAPPYASALAFVPESE